MSTEEESTPVLDAQDEQLLKRIAHHHAPPGTEGRQVLRHDGHRWPRGQLQRPPRDR